VKIKGMQFKTAAKKQSSDVITVQIKRNTPRLQDEGCSKSTGLEPARLRVMPLPNWPRDDDKPSLHLDPEPSRSQRKKSNTWIPVLRTE
jgi:hypothetical protein